MARRLDHAQHQRHLEVRSEQRHPPSRRLPRRSSAARARLRDHPLPRDLDAATGAAGEERRGLTVDRELLTRLWRALKDPNAKAAFIADLMRQGIEIPDDLALDEDGTTPAPSHRIPVGKSQIGTTILASVARARHALTGEARKEFEQAWGKSTPPYIGPTRSPEGRLRIHAGCPGEYRAQQRGARR